MAENKKQRTRTKANGQGSLYKRNGTGCWIAAWSDEHGKRRTKTTGTTDKTAASRILSKLVTDKALRQSGVIDSHSAAIYSESRRSIESQLTAFEARMISADRDPKHIGATVGYIRVIAKSQNWDKAADITSDSVCWFTSQLKSSGKSARTIQAYLTSIKAFTKWLLINQKIQRDPLTDIAKPNPKNDRRLVRRMLLPDEWEWLKTVTGRQPDRCGMTGTERVLLYCVAIQTGLRSGELRSLTIGKLFLSEANPFIVCDSADTKNTENAKQYIQSDLADELSQHISMLAPVAPIFKMPHKANVAKMLKVDLLAARNEWLEAVKHDCKEYSRRLESDFLRAVNHEGKRLDFHALRHTTGAWLAQAGCNPKTVQVVMRHSTITITMDTYGHLFPGQEVEAIGRLPAMMQDKNQELKPTGTDVNLKIQQQ